jgi:hypothetical protein
MPVSFPLSGAGEGGALMSIRCSECGFEVPMQPGPYTTCPRCGPQPEVSSRIAAELVEAALSRSDAETALRLLQSAEAWRSIARARVTGDAAGEGAGEGEGE